MLAGHGQFRASSGVVIREPARVLIVFYPWTSGRNRGMERIRSRSERDFDQEAVLRVDDVSCVSFCALPTEHGSRFQELPVALSGGGDGALLRSPQATKDRRRVYAPPAENCISGGP